MYISPLTISARNIAGSYIVNRVTFYPQSNEEWSDCNCSSVKVEDLIFIANIIKIERSKLRQIEIVN